MEQESYKPREAYSTRHLYVYTQWAFLTSCSLPILKLCDMFPWHMCVLFLHFNVNNYVVYFILKVTLEYQIA